jgi:hypothetical protein
MTDTTTPTPTAPTAASTFTPPVEPHTKSGISASEAATIEGWIKYDLAKGKMTPEQAAKAFDDIGTPLESRGPDLRTAAEKELDSAFPPSQARDFTIRYGGRVKTWR